MSHVKAIPKSAALRVFIAVVGTCMVTGSMLSLFPVLLQSSTTAFLPDTWTESWKLANTLPLIPEEVVVEEPIPEPEPEVWPKPWRRVAASVDITNYKDAPQYGHPALPLERMPVFQEIPNEIYERMEREGKRVPNIVHYFWLTPEDGVPSATEFPFLFYLSMRSAMVVVKPDIMFLHCNGLPTGPWWDAVAPNITVNYFNNFDKVYGNPIHAAAQKTDVIRIIAMNHYGGIAFDMDTFAIGDHEELRYAPATIGLQNGGIPYACAAWVMYERGSLFGHLWLNEYKHFADAVWDMASGQTSFMLAKALPNDVQVLSVESTFSPNWWWAKTVVISDEIDLIGDGHYVYHAWWRYADKEYKALTPARIRDEDISLHRVLRRYINEETFRIWDQLHPVEPVAEIAVSAEPAE